MTRITYSNQVQRPIGKVHTDYTVHSAPRRLLDLTRPPTSNDTWSKYLQGGPRLRLVANKRQNWSEFSKGMWNVVTISLFSMDQHNLV